MTHHITHKQPTKVAKAKAVSKPIHKPAIPAFVDPPPVEPPARKPASMVPPPFESPHPFQSAKQPVVITAPVVIKPPVAVIITPEAVTVAPAPHKSWWRFGGD